MLVLMSGRALSVRWAAENIPAILQAWEPGALGGQALAEILCGKVNPSGKLPVTIPRSVGQIPTTYDYKGSQYSRQYSTSRTGCLFPFGYTEPGVIAAVLLTLGFCFYVFVFRKKGWDKRTVLIFMLLGAVVFIRYFVLHNHSYGHYFFTYRAQASVMLAVLLSAAEITGARVRHGKKT